MNVNFIIIHHYNFIIVMQRNKSKKLYTSFHKAQARLTDPCKSQIIYKNKNENHINFESVKRVTKESSMICPYEGKSVETSKSISKSSTARNLKIQKDRKGWKQIGYGSKGNGPLSNRIMKQLTNFNQKKREEVKENMDENKRECRQTNNRTIQSTVNNKIIQQFSPLPDQCLQIEQFVADFSIPKNDKFVESKLVYEDQEVGLQQRQELLISLDEINVRLQEFGRQNSTITESWMKTIQLDSKFNSYVDDIQKLSNLIKDQDSQSQKLKTELFSLNRDFVSNKKMKEHKSKNSRESILADAENLHEDLRKKLSSKADYEHIILFNQKVILSGVVHPTFASVYQEMFEGQLSKKFGLIVKKQLSNLAHYDIKLVQEYLKRIQDLQNAYVKVEQRISINNESVGMEEYLIQVERLVQIIQQKTIKIQKMQSYSAKYKQSKDKIHVELEEEFGVVNSEIRNMSEKISEEYEQVEGKSYDFKKILQEKWKEKFNKFRIIFDEKREVERKLKKAERK